MSFEKFTDKARKVLVLAQDELARFISYVGTEHILLGLIQEKDGLAAQALDRLNVKYDAVVQAIRQVVAIDEDTDVSGHLSFTPRVKRVLENSLREAMQMGQSYISTEHLLLGIVREGDGTALEVLTRLGVSGDDVRSALNDLVGQSPVYAGRNPFRSERQHVRQRAEGVRHRPHAEGARRQAGPGYRPRRRDRARHAGAQPTPEEQPAAHRRAGRGQDRRGRGPGAAHRVEPGTRHPARQAPVHARRERARGRVEGTAASSRSA